MLHSKDHIEVVVRPGAIFDFQVKPEKQMHLPFQYGTNSLGKDILKESEFKGD